MTFKPFLTVSGLALALGLSACNVQVADETDAADETEQAETISDAAPEDYGDETGDHGDETDEASDSDHAHEDGVGEAHVHGEAEAVVTLTGETLTINLQGALASFAGFEYSPETDAEIAEMEETMSRLEDAEQNWFINPEGECRAQQISLQVKRSAESGHGNIDTTYIYNCAAPDKVTMVRALGFQAFDPLEKLDITAITEGGQVSKSLSENDDTLTLSR